MGLAGVDIKFLLILLPRILLPRILNETSESWAFAHYKRSIAFWSVFCRTHTKYGDLKSKSPYLVWI